eukprot:1146552-Pelagomonas_calceolata.AAC.2
MSRASACKRPSACKGQVGEGAIKEMMSRASACKRPSACKWPRAYTGQVLAKAKWVRVPSRR